jgi:subtilisin family serine protease
VPVPAAGGAIKPATAQVGKRPAASGVRSIEVDNPVPKPDSIRRDEILAVNASTSVLRSLQQRGFQPVEQIAVASQRTNVTRLRVPSGLTALQAQEFLNEQYPSLVSTFNRIYRPYVTTQAAAAPLGQKIPRGSELGTCANGRCYGAELINWQPHLAKCATDVSVGIIDTEYDREHPAFAGRHIAWGDMRPPLRTAAQQWHGTGVLSVLAGHPKSSTPGLIPDAKFFVANSFYADDSGQPITDTAALIRALEWLGVMEAKIINLSLAGPEDPLLYKIIKNMSGRGIVFIAAAGNEGASAAASYPAAYPEVIAVTAVDRNMRVYRHANQGAYIDVAAPGVDIWTALPERKEGTQTGTSFAVPYVTAIVAAAYPTDELAYAGRPLDPANLILGRLSTRDLGAPGQDKVYGRGLLLAPNTCGQPAGQPWAALTTPKEPAHPVQPWALTLIEDSPSQNKWAGAGMQVSFQPGQD